MHCACACVCVSACVCAWTDHSPMGVGGCDVGFNLWPFSTKKVRCRPWTNTNAVNLFEDDRLRTVTARVLTHKQTNGQKISQGLSTWRNCHVWPWPWPWNWPWNWPWQVWSKVDKHELLILESDIFDLEWPWPWPVFCFLTHISLIY